MTAVATSYSEPVASTFDGAYSLLKLRWAALNLVALALIGAAWMNGWVQMALDADMTRLTYVIVAVFVYGMWECSVRIQQTSNELNHTRMYKLVPGTAVTSYIETNKKRDGHSRRIASDSLKLKLMSRIGMIRHLAHSLVGLGLIGTVLGFIIALSGVDPSTAGDVSAISPMVSGLIAGMHVALWTTFIGAILNIWLLLNYKLLEGGQVKLCTALIERTETERERNQ